MYNIASAIRSSIHEGTDGILSYNENDIMEKLGRIDLSLDPATGEVKCLKELNSLGGKKPAKPDCPVDKKSSKSKRNKLNVFF